MRNTIGSYRIERQLGEGGMGIVYAAFDERLRRAVAVKMLRSQGPDGTGRERLWREARAAAAVSHPNVCQIYDVGEADGEIYVAMELLDGESLGARLALGPLEPGEAFQVMLAVLAALDAIHRRGLVHRDLKPSNVFLTPHGVKLVDFGLAVPVTSGEPYDATRITQPGVIVGTPHYMSPEQVRGQPVDARADLFAAGILLSEMLAGRPPFDGPTPVDVLHAVLHESPRVEAQALGRAAPVVARALAKRPEDRYDSARMMTAALQVALGEPRRTGTTGISSATVQPPTPMTRLIVLPFRLLRADPEIDFLEVGLADAITTSLSELGSLIVRSTLTALKLAQKAPPDLAVIAREADVDVVLSGTLLRAGSSVRVATQLIEVPEGTVLWSDHAQVALDDVFKFHDDLAERIVSSLELPLTAREHRLMHQNVPASARAYENYLRAVRFGTQPSRWIEARHLLERCVAEDAGFAPAWARLGRMYRVLAKFGEESADSDYAQAEAAFEKALQISPELGLAHAGYAALEVDLGRATDAVSRLLALARRQTADASVFSALVLACRYCGLLEASVAAHQRAKILDPRVQTSVAHTHAALGHYRRALEESEATTDLSRAFLLALCGRTDEAIAHAEVDEARTHGIEALIARFFRLVMLERRDDARAVLQQILASNMRDPEGFYYLALNTARLGDLDRCGELLSRAVEGGYTSPAALMTQRWLTPMHTMPAFVRALAISRERQQQALEIYTAAGGAELLGVPGR